MPVHLAFLGCGFITGVHSRHMKALRQEISCSYASRDASRAEAFRRRFGGVRSYGDYQQALEDPSVDAVVIAVPPQLHMDLTRARGWQARACGKAGVSAHGRLRDRPRGA